MSAIEDSVCKKIQERAKFGLKKYNVSLEDGNYSNLEMLKHLQEELMDAANYAEVLIQLHLGNSDKDKILKEYLFEHLHYNPVTGIFTWIKSPVSNVFVGTEAGSPNDRGYIQIYLKGTSYRAHRLAFLYMEGAFPSELVDHVNGNPSDNSWANLRKATSVENGYNSKVYTNSKSGIKGVSWNKANNKWVAQITIDKKKIHLGYFADIVEAEKAVKEAREAAHKIFTNNGYYETKLHVPGKDVLAFIIANPKEEAMDLANYLEVRIQQIEKTVKEKDLC